METIQGWEFAHSLICSFRSNQMSNLSDSLRLLKTNEHLWANRAGHSRQWATVSESLRSLMTTERPWASRSAHDKWALWANCSGRSPKMSNPLRSLTKNEQMSESLVFLTNRSFAHFFAKNTQFAQKTNERISSPETISWIENLKFKNLMTHSLTLDKYRLGRTDDPTLERPDSSKPLTQILFHFCRRMVTFIGWR